MLLVMSYDNWKNTDMNDDCDDCDAPEESIEEPAPQPYCRAIVTGGGSYLRCYVDELSPALMQRAFGKPDTDGFWDPDGGYDGLEWTFVDEPGRAYHLYFRWGQARIGAREGVSEQMVTEFRQWLLRNVGVQR